MSKHTPGPWKLDAGRCIRTKSGSFTLHKCNDWQDPCELDANARLIAASPDMLEALKALASTARTFRNVPKDEQEWTSLDDAALESAFDAIAKAEGRES